MPTVDFTLEELLQATAQQTTTIVGKALAEERVYTQQLITTSLLSFWENNLEPAFEAIHDEIDELRLELKSHTPLLAQHSQDIMGLRATVYHPR